MAGFVVWDGYIVATSPALGYDPVTGLESPEADDEY